MAHTMFDNEELKNQLFFEITKHPDGVNPRGFVEFHGFYTDDALSRFKPTRRATAYNTSDYLYFLAEMFAKTEDRDRPTLANLCSESEPIHGGMTNLRDTTCPTTGQPCTRGCFDLRAESPGPKCQ